jgi:signal transduction histidine kinase
VAGATDGHLGLLGMTERVAILGGEMSVRSQPGVGTTITVEMPLTGVGQ